MILFDTGPIVAAAFTTEDRYPACTDLFTGLRLASRRLLLPATVSAEAGYLIEKLAERLNITEVATLDRRHFTVVQPRHVEALTLLPDEL